MIGSGFGSVPPCRNFKGQVKTRPLFLKHCCFTLLFFSRLVMNPSSARCRAKERARCTASRMSSSWRARATRAWDSPWWAARTRTRDPSASTSRASFPTDRPLVFSKKVSAWRINHVVFTSLLLRTWMHNAHFCIFYMCKERLGTQITSFCIMSF